MKNVLTTAALLATLTPTAAAFASTTTVTGTQETQTSQLDITGTIANDQGQLPEQITVTLPTAVSFSVDKDSNFVAATNMEIVNDSGVAVNVAVSSFADATPNAGTGITVLNESVLTGNEDQYDRSFVTLSLAGQSSLGGSTAHLVHGMTESALVSVPSKNNAQLTLTGNAGTADHATATNKNTDTNFADNGASETFNLTFKISR